MNYRIANGSLLLQGEAGFEVVKKDLWIRQGVISRIGEAGGPDEEDYQTVDAGGKLVMPGLINMHTHVYMTAMRNYADDVPFDEWLFRRVMPVEEGLSQEAAYWTSLLGMMEMISTGTTCFVDMHMFRGQSCRAAQTAGMRAYIGRGLVGEDLYGDGMGRFQEALDEQAEFESELLRFVLSPHAIYSCSPKLYAQVAEEAEKRGLLRQTHLSESTNEVEDALAKYGRTPVEVLRDTGFLSGNTMLAHCVKLRGDDMEILRSSGSSVVTNPASNAKLGNGFAPVSGLWSMGVNVCLGTDGTASNNTLNMFREMGLLSLLHKAVTGDCTAASANDVIAAATVNGARALNREGQLGVIREGSCADLIFLDLQAPSLYPANNMVSSLCYSANGSEVDSVMIGGRFVMRGRQLLTIDRERVYWEVDRIVEKYL